MMLPFMYILAKIGLLLQLVMAQSPPHTYSWYSGDIAAEIDQVKQSENSLPLDRILYMMDALRVNSNRWSYIETQVMENLNIELDSEIVQEPLQNLALAQLLLAELQHNLDRSSLDTLSYLERGCSLNALIKPNPATPHPYSHYSLSARCSSLLDTVCSPRDQYLGIKPVTADCQSVMEVIVSSRQLRETLTLSPTAEVVISFSEDELHTLPIGNGEDDKSRSLSNFPARDRRNYGEIASTLYESEHLLRLFTPEAPGNPVAPPVLRPSSGSITALYLCVLISVSLTLLVFNKRKGHLRKSSNKHASYKDMCLPRLLSMQSLVASIWSVLLSGCEAAIANIKTIVSGTHKAVHSKKASPRKTSATPKGCLAGKKPAPVTLKASKSPADPISSQSSGSSRKSSARDYNLSHGLKSGNSETCVEDGFREGVILPSGSEGNLGADRAGNDMGSVDVVLGDTNHPENGVTDMALVRPSDSEEELDVEVIIPSLITEPCGTSAPNPQLPLNDSRLMPTSVRSLSVSRFSDYVHSDKGYVSQDDDNSSLSSLTAPGFEGMSDIGRGETPSPVIPFIADYVDELVSEAKRETSAEVSAPPTIEDHGDCFRLFSPLGSTRKGLLFGRPIVTVIGDESDTPSSPRTNKSWMGIDGRIYSDELSRSSPVATDINGSYSYWGGGSAVSVNSDSSIGTRMQSLADASIHSLADPSFGFGAPHIEPVQKQPISPPKKDSRVNSCTIPVVNVSGSSQLKFSMPSTWDMLGPSPAPGPIAPALAGPVSNFNRYSGSGSRGSANGGLSFQFGPDADDDISTRSGRETRSVPPGFEER